MKDARQNATARLVRKLQGEAEEETMSIKAFGDFVDECESWWSALTDVASVDVEDTAPSTTVFTIVLRNGRELLVEITER